MKMKKISLTTNKLLKCPKDKTNNDKDLLDINNLMEAKTIRQLYS